MDNINKADIVTRMRWIDDGWEIWNPGEHKPTKNVGKWCHEAADEIERLREHLSTIRRLAMRGEMDTIVEAAEIERLREALFKAANTNNKTNPFNAHVDEVPLRTRGERVMSYCRWSDCDVYVYEDVNGGWTTHVATRRNRAGKGPPLDWTTTETLMKSYQAFQDWSKANNEYVDIDLPSAGMSFNDSSPGDCADRLEELRAEGFDVPQYAIDALREDARSALEEKE